MSEAFEVMDSANLTEDDLNGHIVKIKARTDICHRRLGKPDVTSKQKNGALTAGK